ncbi:MAG: hypothetical protein HY075_08270 [Deltaproteobacteria bacterium]|nr:hypothetical protein [Deltaproteobacteria bacterium]
MMKRFFTPAVVLLFFWSTALASERGQKKLGLTGEYNFGSELLGAAFAVNATDWFRLQLGYAFPAKTPNKFNAQLEGAGKLFVPDWNFSPYIGLGSGPSSGTIAVIIGVDYTAQSGFNLGAGYSQVSTNGASGTVIYIGYYF